MPNTLTIAEAARRCGVACRTLQRAIRAGRLTLTADHRLTLDALQQAGYAAATTPQGHTAATTSQRYTAATPQQLSLVLDPLLVRLDTLIARIEGLTQALAQWPAAATPRRRDAGTVPRDDTATTPPVTPQATPHPSPQILGTYDPRAAAARIHTLRREGLSFVQIATRLDEEDIQTRYGLPWQHSSVRHLLKTYGDA